MEWHFFTAGTATVRMEAAGAEHRVISEADSAGAIGLLYTVRDRFEATFDPHTFCSIRVTKHSEEGSHKRETQIQFDYAHGKSRLDEKNLKTGEIKNVESEIPSCVTDVVTGFYYLASLPLEAGASYTIPISDGGKVADVRIHVEGRESVKTPSGTYPAIRVAADALSGPLKGRGKVWVWYSDDTSRMPVQMRAKLTWGTLLFRLQRVDRKAPN